MPNTHESPKNNGKIAKVKILLKNNKIMLFSLIPSMIIIVLFIIEIIFCIFDIKVSYDVIHLLSNENNFEKFAEEITYFRNNYDTQLIQSGISVISVAISVWIGLNIYNIVKKSDIDKLEKTAKETRIEFDEFSRNYRQFNLMAIENVYISEDRVCKYYVEEFKNSEMLDYKLTKTIVLFEKSFSRIIKSYNDKNLKMMFEALNELNAQIEWIKSHINVKLINESDKILFNSYLNCREGDYNYYTALYHKEQHEPDSAIKYLNDARKKYSNVLQNGKIQDETVNIYINNVQSYIVQLLCLLDDNKDNKKKYAEKAYSFSKSACSVDGEFIETGYARDHRNYGVNIEQYIKYYYEKNSKGYIEHLLEAYNQYQIAYKFDEKDVKTLTCLSSIVLKIFDAICEIDKDEYFKTEHANKNYFDERIKELNIQCDFFQLLFSAERYINITLLLYPSCIQGHYHNIHLCTYKAIIYKRDSQKHFDLAESEIMKCKYLLNNDLRTAPLPFLYKARNYYYSLNNTAEMEKYNEIIKQRK